VLLYTGSTAQKRAIFWCEALQQILNTCKHRNCNVVSKTHNQQTLVGCHTPKKHTFFLLIQDPTYPTGFSTNRPQICCHHPARTAKRAARKMSIKNAKWLLNPAPPKLPALTITYVPVCSPTKQHWNQWHVMKQGADHFTFSCPSKCKLSFKKKIIHTASFVIKMYL
jgi:hypothetical protein